MDLMVKLSYITGLESVVVAEIKKHNLFVLKQGTDCVYVAYSPYVLTQVKQMRSVTKVYIVLVGRLYHPGYIARHKSILRPMIDIVITQDVFRTYRFTCAGEQSGEVVSICRYISETYDLAQVLEADLKIHSIKVCDEWELGVQITPRPLSMRRYRVFHMSGAMDPTIAYAMNEYACLGSAHSYLNIFSGSGTLLIEACQTYSHIQRYVGFDNTKKHISGSIQNIKKAGLLRSIQVHEYDIAEQPDLGMFDAIVSDLPFGMVISKTENLEELYTSCIRYCERVLTPQGRLVLYTSEYLVLERVIRSSRFRILEEAQVSFMTNAHAYLRPKIIVCGFADV